MKRLYIAPPLAVAAVLAFAPLAYADTMVGGMNFTDEQMSQVHERCTELATAGATAETKDHEAVDTPNADGASDADALTLEDCQAAGLAQ